MPRVKVAAKKYAQSIQQGTSAANALQNNTTTHQAGESLPQKLFSGKINEKHRVVCAKPQAQLILKKRRVRAGAIALREIKRYQRMTDHLLAKAPFQRFVRHVTETIDK